MIWDLSKNCLAIADCPGGGANNSTCINGDGRTARWHCLDNMCATGAGGVYPVLHVCHRCWGGGGCIRCYMRATGATRVTPVPGVCTMYTCDTDVGGVYPVLHV
ncbi:hypothetical protein MAR_010499 [Mya arenaria]|uniref:Uncharacterized protein n=1 Tax=Mya arenaria TaxID=6604 RepID=A0ABY7E9X4_MYAAR|nr:hypothetical protein MAR_010499 [Mya arenaria]